MNILEMMLQNSGQISTMAKSLGLDQTQIESAIKQLTPALAQSVQRNATSTDGLSNLVNALQKKDHTRYIAEDDAIAQPEAISEGNKILGHLLGDKEVSRAVASQASEKSGIDSGILRKMLPMLATMFMGSMSKQASSSSSGLGSLAGMAASMFGGSSSKSGGGLTDILGNFLDFDHDGSSLDDIMGMATKFLK